MCLSTFGSVSVLFGLSHPESKVICTWPPNGQQHLENKCGAFKDMLQPPFRFCSFEHLNQQEEMNAEGNQFTWVTGTEAKSRQ
jgi:hypothetical protein